MTARAVRRCGVLGDPISHSLSPVLHRAAYDALGLDWSYDAHRVPSGGLAAFLGGLAEDWRGLSLTMPLKREVLPLVDRLSDRARLAGAVNTLLIEDDGTRLGDNTDLPGALPQNKRYKGMDTHFPDGKEPAYRDNTTLSATGTRTPAVDVAPT